MQRTALVALQRREAVRAANTGGGIRGWLRRVLYHEARSGWRQDRNRRAREGDYASAGPGEDQGLDKAVGSLDFTKRLVAAVEALDEPYRSVVVARYFHGQSVAAFAEDHGLPLRTVETRLRRARAKMRELLSSTDGIGMGSWAPMVLLHWGGPDLGGLVTSSAVAGASVSAATKTATATAWGGAWFAGMMAMNVKVVLGCTAALVAGLIGAMQWGASDGAAPAPELTASAGAFEPAPNLAEVGAVVTQREGAVDPPAPEIAAVEPAEPASGFVALIEALPPGTLDVWVVDDADQPVVGAKVLVSDAKGVFTGWAPPKLPDDAPRQVQSVGAGSLAPVRFEGLADGSWFIQVTSPGGAERMDSVKLVANRGTTTIVRFGSARIFGRVTDGTGTGTPIPGAYLSLSARRRVLEFTEAQKGLRPPLSHSIEQGAGQYVLTDDRGEYSFDELSADAYRLGVDGTVTDWDTGTHVQIPERFIGVDLGEGEVRRMDFPPGAEEGSVLWKGRVVDASGNPVVTPDFQFRCAEIRVASWDADALLKPATFQGRGDANLDERTHYGLDGTFEMRLPPGRYDVWVTTPNHKERLHVLEASDFVMEPGATVTRDLVLPGITLRGTVDVALQEDVQTWCNAKLFGKDTVTLSARPSHVTYPSGILHAGMDSSGAFTLYGLEAGEWIFTALKGAGRTEMTIPEGVKEASTVLLPK